MESLMSNMSENRVFILGRDELPAKLSLNAGEHVNWCFIALPGVSADYNLEAEILGPDAELNLSGIYLCSGDDRLSIKLKLKHSCGNSVSRQLFKGILAGKAKSLFDARIVVAQDAQKTEAYQTNHNLLLSNTAIAETLPQLEIYADDVKCSHGATVGKLNEEEQFYMRSRGIREADAKFLQMQSFLAPVLSMIEDTQEREMLEDQIEKALRNIIL